MIRDIRRMMASGHDLVKRVLVMVPDFLRNSGSLVFQKIKRTIRWIFKKAALVIAFLALIFTGWQACLLKKQIELENRPYVSVENPYWWYKRDANNSVWLGIGFDRSNYGQRPAEGLEFRNFRAVTIAIDDGGLKEKIERQTQQGMKQYLSEYIADERKRLIFRLMDALSSYFREHPDVDKTTLERFLGSLPQALKGDKILFYEGRPLFRLTEVNNEMKGYQRQRVIVYPTRSKPQGGMVIEQMGSAADVLDGQNLLVVFLAFRYQSVFQDMSYSTFFLGYSDRSSERKIQEGRNQASLSEFQSWPSEETAGVLSNLLRFLGCR